MDYNRVVKIVETKQTADGKSSGRWIRKFNANEQIVQEYEYLYDFKDGTEFLWKRTVLRYTVTGKIGSRYEFTGHFPSITGTGYGARDLEKTTTYEYDENGRVIRAVEEGDDENTGERMEHITIFDYFEDGTKIGKRYRRYNGENTLAAVEHYDQYGHLIQEDSYLGAFLFVTKFRKYDLGGHLLEESWRYEDTGHPQSKNYEVGVIFPFGKYEYDANGNKIASFSFKGQTGEISWECHCVYNEQNQLIQSSSIYHDEPERDHTTTFEYEVTVRNVDSADGEEDISALTSSLPQNAQILLEKARQGDADAMAQVASNYYSGKDGFPKDDKLAFYWSEKVATAYPDYDFALEMLGRCYEFGVGTEENIPKAIELFKESVRLGKEDLLYDLAELLYFESAEDRKAECLPFLERAVANQDKAAEALLGDIYVSGRLQTNDRQRGIDLLARSAEHGDTQGARVLASAYLHQIDGCEQVIPYDPSIAAKYFAIAVENGEDSAKALYYAGPAYFYGEGVPKNMEKARKCFEALIDEYVPEVKIFDLLGCMCFEGIGGGVDYTLGEKALRKAMESSDAEISLEAMNNLGMYLCTLTNRLSEAIQLLEKAADQGNSNAQVNLGKAYYEGKGVPQNMETAAYYFGLAAKQGNQTAIDNLNVMGTSRNFSHDSSEQERHPIRGGIIGLLVGGFIGIIIGLSSGAEWIADVLALLGLIIGIIKG